jgi:peroxiredoxin
MSPRLQSDVAPDFALTDVHGVAVHLADWNGKKNVVLVFNRGLT